VSTVRDFKLPDLGEGLEEGEIVEWHVAVGDVVELNQPVASIETAKAVVEVPSPFAGRVVERVGEVGEELQVGTVFLRIDTDVAGGAAPAQAEEPAAVAASTGLDADSEPQPLVGYGNREGSGGRRRRRRGGEVADGGGNSEITGRPLAKPPVRKLAKDLGVDLAAAAPGSGPDGIITRDDVRAAAARTIVDTQAPEPPAPAPAPAPTPQAPAVERPARDVVQSLLGAAVGTAGEKPVPGFRGRRPGEVEKVAGIRKRIIQKMETSRRDIPHALCSRDADLTRLWELRKSLTTQAQADGFDVKITPFAVMMRATVLALRRFPTLNAVYDQEAGEIRLHEHINLGVAVDTERGLIVPNIKDAHAKSTLQLAVETAELAAKCRDGSATPGELTGGTFTVDNYGFFGNDDGNPIINAPEVGILGIGAIRERPWVVDGQLAVRRVARFTLAFDHRVCDGGEAGRFVTYVADLCEDPARILLHV
jgi:2-oxoisovalerate dehydrogenase E2 component (dihydrolipoyl transacylase)